MQQIQELIARNALNEEKTNNGRGMEVVCAGFSKSGTMSLYAGLGILGYRCYHMIECLQSAEACRKWHKVLKAKDAGRLEQLDFDCATLLEGYNAGVDAPVMELYKEIADRYPTAKVILTVRDPVAWFNSMDDTMGKYHWWSWSYIAASWWSPELWAQIHMARYLVKGWINKYGGGKWGPHMMQPRIDEVRAAIPPERLLVYDVKEGWEPLCKFLEQPILAEPFPRVNDGASMRSLFWGITVVGLSKWAATLAGTVVAGCLLRYGARLPCLTG